jgi:drug/metabolite transporter (DMT)-like permease
LTLGVVWGCSFIFIKLGLEFLTPFGVAFVRCALGAITLIIIVIARRFTFPRDIRIWLHLWIISLLLNSIPGVLFALAETEVTSILAGILNATTPLMTISVIFLAFREEKPQRHQIIGLILGAVGVLVVLGVWEGIGNNPIWAVAVLLAATLCYGISFPYSRKFIIPLKLQPEVAAATQLIVATTTLLPFFIFNGLANYDFRTDSVSAMLAMGIFGSGFAYIWNFQIIERAGSAIASTVTYVTPVVAVVVGILFLSENLKWYEPVGALIVLFGAATSQGRFSRFFVKA